MLTVVIWAGSRVISDNSATKLCENVLKNVRCEYFSSGLRSMNVFVAAKAGLTGYDIAQKAYHVRQGFAKKSITINPFFVMNVSYYTLTKFEDAQ